MSLGFLRHTNIVSMFMEGLLMRVFNWGGPVGN